MMRLFKKNKTDKYASLSHQTAVEIAETKNAQDAAFEEAYQVGKDLNRVLENNGFTIKIYLATGGHIKPKRIEK